MIADRDHLAAPLHVWLAAVLVIVGPIAGGVVWLVRSTSGAARPREGTPPTSSSAREILDQRYARGELSREDYLAIWRDLEEPG